MSKKKITVRELTILAVLTIILFIQEQLLSFLPNFQLTVFLLILYSKKLGTSKTLIICIIHVILDNLIMGSLNPLYIIFMLIGWVIIPITINTIFKKVDSNIILAFIGMLYSFIYCWLFSIPNCILWDMNFITYLTFDIIWEVIFASSSFLTIILFYKPCSKVFDKYIIKQEISK